MPTLFAHRSLLTFAMTSLALHLLLLVGFRPSETTAVTSALGLPWINIDLRNPDGQTPLVSPTTAASAGALPDATKDDRPAVEAATSVSGVLPAPGHGDTVADRHKPAVAMNASANVMHNQLLGMLQTRLSRYLVYPPLARSRGWEGTVLLGLHMESDGHFGKISIERGSGYAVLDDSALNSLKRLGHLVEAGAWLNGRSIDMQLPVIYQLIEN